MNRSRMLPVLIVALLAGGALAFGTYNYLQNVPVKTVTVPTKRVVVANADLPLGSELRSDDLKTIEWPASAAPEGSFEDAKALIGRGLISSIVRHEPILPGKLSSKEAGSGLPPIIPTGKRAMSVRVNEVIGVAGYVLPGTRVDVIATQASNRGEDMTSKVVLSNVQVLTAGTRVEHDTK
ncbi:MAG TPA: Flp pilus assembly protein CpaB, partial [Vicinamibacterales bacterium]|nr:Flp pilus assembly protein CpaB [Vicinamibacterales bacterium]